MAGKVTGQGMLPMLGVCILLIAGGAREISPQQGRSPAVSGTRLVWPGFDVAVTLSPAAEKKLHDSNETLRAFGSYSGTPKPGAQKQYVDEEGRVDLGGFDQDFPLDGRAHVQKVSVGRAAFEQTDGKTPRLLVNVVSARRSFKNNLLACDIFEDKLDAIRGGQIPIACKLIGE